MTRSQYSVVLWYTAVVLWLTWAPFIPGSGVNEVIFALPSNLIEVALNVLLIAPVGLVAGLAAGSEEGSEKGYWPAVRLALILAIPISALAECGQLFIVDRSPSPFDLFLNTAGAAGAAWIGCRLRQRGVGPKNGVLLSWTHLYGAALVYVLAMASFHQGAHELHRWVGSYPLLAADEIGGGREYTGTVEDAEICAGAGARSVCAAPGADAETRRRIAASAVRQQRVTMRARVTSRSSRQSGPARILTFSDGVLQRNATIAQEGADLVLRLRTPLAGQNGSDVEFRLAGAIPEGIPTRVSASYETGEVTLQSHREGTHLVKKASYPLLVWTRIMAWEVNRYHAVQVTLAGVLGVVVLFFPAGLLTATLVARASPPARWIAGLAAGTGLYALVTARLAFPFDPEWFAVALGTAWVGMSVGSVSGTGKNTSLSRSRGA